MLKMINWDKTDLSRVYNMILNILVFVLQAYNFLTGICIFIT